MRSFSGHHSGGLQASCTQMVTYFSREEVFSSHVVTLRNLLIWIFVHFNGIPNVQKVVLFHFKSFSLVCVMCVLGKGGWVVLTRIFEKTYPHVEVIFLLFYLVYYWGFWLYFFKNWTYWSPFRRFLFGSFVRSPGRIFHTNYTLFPWFHSSVCLHSFLSLWILFSPFFWILEEACCPFCPLWNLLYKHYCAFFEDTMLSCFFIILVSLWWSLCIAKVSCL